MIDGIWVGIVEGYSHLNKAILTYYFALVHIDFTWIFQGFVIGELTATFFASDHFWLEPLFLLCLESNILLGACQYFRIVLQNRVT
jgi:hypothetical protein